MKLFLSGKDNYKILHVAGLLVFTMAKPNAWKVYFTVKMYKYAAQTHRFLFPNPTAQGPSLVYISKQYSYSM